MTAEAVEVETHGYEYISISWAGTSKSGKTNVYSVTNNRSGDKLGSIMWWGPWRQYVFFPQSGTLDLPEGRYVIQTWSLYDSRYGEYEDGIEILGREGDVVAT